MSDREDDRELLEKYGLLEDVPAEQVTRSPTPSLTPSPTQTFDPTDLVGASEIFDNLKKNSPAFSEYLKKRIAQTRPVINRPSFAKARSWAISFGPVTIQPGQTVTQTVTPRYLFRGEKFLAAESVPGATLISNIFVGCKQQPSYSSMKTLFFNPQGLGYSVPFDTCQSGIPISITIVNQSDVPCQLDGVIFGKAVI